MEPYRAVNELFQSEKNNLQSDNVPVVMISKDEAHWLCPSCELPQKLYTGVVMSICSSMCPHRQHPTSMIPPPPPVFTLKYPHPSLLLTL